MKHKPPAIVKRTEKERLRLLAEEDLFPDVTAPPKMIRKKSPRKTKNHAR